MGRRKIEEKNIRKLSQVGEGSLAITIPIELIRKLGWRRKQKVVVSEKGGKIIIEDWKG